MVETNQGQQNAESVRDRRPCLEQTLLWTHDLAAPSIRIAVGRRLQDSVLPTIPHRLQARSQSQNEHAVWTQLCLSAQSAPHPSQAKESSLQTKESGSEQRDEEIDLYVCMYVYIYMYVGTYVIRERERYRETERKRGRERERARKSERERERKREREREREKKKERWAHKQSKLQLPSSGKQSVPASLCPTGREEKGCGTSGLPPFKTWTPQRNLRLIACGETERNRPFWRLA